MLKDNRATQLILGTAIIIVFTSALAIWFYYPWLSGDKSLKVFFDSEYYLGYSRKASFKGIQDYVVSLFANRIGPKVMYDVSMGRNTIITFYGVLISLWFYISNKVYLSSLISVILFLNLVFFMSALSLSKEIFVIPAMTFSHSFFKTGRIKFVFLAVIFGLMVRWQLAAAMALAIFVTRCIRDRSLKKIYMFLLPFVLSWYVLVYLSESGESISYWVNQTIKTRGDGSGIYQKLVALDSQGLFFIGVWFKLFYLTFAPLFNFLYSWKFDPLYFHNFAEVTQSLSFTLLLLCYRKKILRMEISHSLFLYTILLTFGMMQIFTPRYLYPVFVYIITYLSHEKSSSHSDFNQKRWYSRINSRVGK